MRNYISAVFFALFILLSPGFCLVQTPSITGATGLIRMPVADVLGQKEYTIGFDYGTDNSVAGTSRAIYSYKVTMGSMLGYGKGLEFGFLGHNDTASDRIKEGVLINMKYSLSSDNAPDALHLAIGVENLSSYTETDVYMVASKYFKGGAGIHFGALFDFPNAKFRSSGMLGLTMPLGQDNIVLMGEVFAGETLFEANAGAKLMINKQLGLILRAFNVSNSATAKTSQSFMGGISLQNPL